MLKPRKEILRVILAIAASCSLVASLLVNAQPAAAGSWLVDDGCGPGFGYYGYFWAAGPAEFWYVTTSYGGINGCFMYTTTLDGNQGGYPLNLAWWYADSVTPGENGYAQLAAYMPGYFNSCGSAFYNVFPDGDTGPNNSYYVSQAAGWQNVGPLLLTYSRDGAKVYLGDKQFCIAGSYISVDAANWTWP
jgi:hypothetical protein